MSSLVKIESPDFFDLEGKKDLIKQTVCKGATDNELALFLHTCQKVGLDPLQRQIYSISRGGQRTIQTGIDGFRLIAERTGNYVPGKESTYVYKEPGSILSCTAYVKKRTSDGTWHEVSATAFFDEYVVKNNPIWRDKPHVMIAKCAEALALRKAFPANLSGLYSNDEMATARAPIESLPEVREIAELQAQEAEILPEKIKLSDVEIMKYAEDVQNRLEKVDGKDYLIDFSKLVDYFKYCQSYCKKSLREGIENLLVNPEDFISSFERWKMKHAT